MIRAVADTHAIIWYLSADPRLSSEAKSLIEHADQHGDKIVVSSITIIEMIYLIEKQKIPAERFSELIAELDNTDSLIVEFPVDLNVARALRGVTSAEIPDMPDRIIAATVLLLDVPIVSRDARIQASTIQTIW